MSSYNRNSSSYRRRLNQQQQQQQTQTGLSFFGKLNNNRSSQNNRVNNNQFNNQSVPNDRFGNPSNVPPAYINPSMSRADSYKSSKPPFIQTMFRMASLQVPKRIESRSEMERDGFRVKTDEKVAQFRFYSFYKAYRGDFHLLCKQINLKKCSPRIRKNMERYSLMIELFTGGNGGEPLCKYFFRVFEIYKMSDCIYVFMEECQSKTLYNRCCEGKKIPPEQCREWIVQITKGVQKILDMGVAHRQLILQHIFFDANQNVKITGWSKSVVYWDPRKDKVIGQQKELKSKLNLHLPPECFHGPYNPGKVDIWSVGVMLVAMQTGRYPFDVRSKARFNSQWEVFVGKHKMNSFARWACNKALAFEPNQRATPEVFLSQAYFTVAEEKLVPTDLKTTKYNLSRKNVDVRTLYVTDPTMNKAPTDLKPSSKSLNTKLDSSKGRPRSARSTDSRSSKKAAMTSDDDGYATGDEGGAVSDSDGDEDEDLNEDEAE